MNDFKYFYLLNEIHAHVLTQQPKYVVAWRANVWVFDDTFQPRMANIPKIIAAQHPQKLQRMEITTVPSLLKWLRFSVGDAIIAKVDNAGNLSAAFADRPLTQTSPLLPKVVKALQQQGIKVKPVFNAGPGQESKPDVLYHGTNTVRLGGILRTGLQPGMKANWTVTTPDRIFLTTDFYTASLHASRSVSKISDEDPNARAVVIAFKIPDPARLNADYDVDKESTPTRERPTQYEGVEPDVKYSTSPFQASKHAGLFSYQGTLGPQTIQQVFVSNAYGSNFQPMPPEDLQRLKANAGWHQPDYSKNFANRKYKKPQEPPTGDWQVNWGIPDEQEDFGDALAAHWDMEPQQPQYPQAIPVAQPAPAPAPKKSWWQRLTGR